MAKSISLFLISVFGVLSLILGVNASPTSAATSSFLNFQARLLTSSGSVVPDGNYNVDFKIYNADSTTGSVSTCSGACLWEETRTGGNQVRVVGGYLTVNLGSVTPFASTINWDQQLYLTMNIGGTGGSPSWDGEMQNSGHSIKLTALPYAFRAGALAKTDGGGNVGTLSFGTTATNPVITLPDATGTVCLQSSASCGFISGSGTAFLQGGNSFGALAVLGTNDANSLALQTNNSSKIVIDTSGNLTFQQASTITNVAAATGTQLTIKGGDASSGNNVGGNLLLEGGAAHGNGAAGSVIVKANGSDSTTAFQVQNSNSRPLLNVDSTNSIVSIGNATDGANLTLAGTGDVNATIRKNMNLSGAVSANDVVEIDTTANGTVKQAAVGSTRVFGIATGTGTPQDIVAYGIYQANTDGTTINRGDLLVVSNATAGKVMSLPAGSTASIGTVVGRAISTVSGGKVWVSLTLEGGGADNLQTAYTNSAGSTTPEIKVDSTRGGVDIQDANSTIGGSLFAVRQANAGGLGTAILDVQSTGNIDITGSLAAKKGTDFSTTGTSNDVNFGNVSLVRLTGASTQIITGIANGRDGYLLTIINAAGQAATISNNSGSSLAANRIITGTSADFSMPAGSSVLLVYDSTSSLWRMNASPSSSSSGVTTVGTYANCTAFSNGASISSTTITLGCADATHPGLIDTGTQTFAGAKTFTGNVAAGANLDITGSLAAKKGTDFSSTGTQNNINFSNASLIRLTNASALTITGIANGRDGYILDLINASGQSVTIKNNDTGDSSAGNVILTGTGSDYSMPLDSAVQLIYDATTSKWRMNASISTLQADYNNSTSPQITVASGTGGVVVQDASSPIGASLFTVQSNGGSSKYLDVSAATASLQVAASGTINIGTDNVATKTINIGSVGSTAQNTTLHIADSSAGVQTITIGSTSSTSTTTIQAGSGNINLTGNVAASANLDVTGSEALKKGTDYSTTGVQHNVSFANASLIRLTGASAQTIGGIANGRDGYNLVLVNAGSVAATILNLDGSSTAANQITTGTGGNISLPVGASLRLIYDATAALWRTSADSTSLQNAYNSSVSPQITVSSALGGVVIQDASSPIGAALFSVQNNGGTQNLFSVTTSTITFEDSGATHRVAIQIDTTNHILKVFSADGTTNYASISATNTDATFLSNTGTTKIGSAAAGSITIGNGSTTAVNITGSANSVWQTTAGSLTVQGGTTLLLESTSANAVTLDSTGTGAINIGTNANAKTITLGNTTGASSLVLQGGTNNINLNPSGTSNTGVIVKPGADSTAALQIQNAAGTTTLFNANTTGLTITIAGNTTNFGDLLLTNAHFTSTQTSAPTIATPLTCGTTPSASVAANSTDSAGSFTIHSGSSTQGKCSAIVTFNKTYGAAPKSITIVPASANSATTNIYVSASSATTFTPAMNVTAPSASTDYTFYYWVVE